jgi:hypothetical protein
MGKNLRILVDSAWLFSDPVSMRDDNVRGRDELGEAFVLYIKKARHIRMGDSTLSDMFVLKPILERFKGMQVMSIHVSATHKFDRTCAHTQPRGYKTRAYSR